MLGNFSFGDYFKDRAIKWAWELSTKAYGLQPSRIWISVFEDDDEAYEIWKGFVPESRIVRMGRADNFWAAGAAGPCGPCSELYYDFHPDQGDAAVDLNDDRRFIEYYNLVFMELNRGADGSLTELQKKNIDTGMGLERMAQILQGVPNNYETDLLFPIIQRAAELMGTDYHHCSESQKRDLKVIGDHMRAVTYLISDGVVPSNLGRGYVLRRLIRRIVMKGRLLGIRQGLTGPLCRVVIDLSRDCDPNVQKQQERILNTLSQEEEAFSNTLAAGQKKLEEFLQSARQNSGVISGAEAFMLFDTFGFPLEITEEIAASDEIDVDVEGFEKEMEAQKQRSKAAQREPDRLASDLQAKFMTLPSTQFLGYDRATSRGRVLAILQNGELQPEISATASHPVACEVVLDRSPFYAESGGQIGDQGTIVAGGDGRSEGSMAKLEVRDVQVGPKAGLTLHKVVLTEGRLGMDAEVVSEINVDMRHRLMCHHTATHLLQSAIKKVLGPVVCQQGSLVAPDRLRFDFNANKALTSEQISQIETLLNGWIQSSLAVTSQVMELEQAKAAGAIAMFGEKYGKEVRVIQVEDVSMELCGGTHVQNTSALRVFKILSESAIQSGIRRIEAVAGPAAVERVSAISQTCDEVKTLLKAELDQIPDRIRELQREVQEKSKEIASLEKETSILKAEKLLSEAGVLADGCRWIVSSVEDVDGKALQSAAGHLIEQLSCPSAVVLGSVQKDRAAFAVAFSPALTKANLHAGKFVAEVAKVCGGRGGGRPNLAQAGAKDAAKFPDAMAFAKSVLLERLNEARLKN